MKEQDDQQQLERERALEEHRNRRGWMTEELNTELEPTHGEN